MSRKRRRRKNRIHPNTPIKPELSFGASLEKYTFKRLSAIPIKWQWIGIGLTTMVIGASIAAGYYSPSPLSSNEEEIIRMASGKGDYALAQKIYESPRLKEKVLGARSELEDLVYPERQLDRELIEKETLNEKYPNNRDILLNLSQIYEMLGDKERAEFVRESARILDPNNPVFSNQ